MFRFSSIVSTFLTLLLILLPLCQATEHAKSTEDQLLHINLQRRNVSESRLYSFLQRPWAAKVISKLQQEPNSVIPVPQLAHPLKLLNNSRALPEQRIEGNVVPLGEYYITLTFGGQPINVQIDTGSSTLAVPLKQCFNCRNNDHRFDMDSATGTRGVIKCDSAACRPNTCHVMPVCTTCSARSRACCSPIVPGACGFFIQYADQSGASGALVQADVGIAGMTVPLAFGAILVETAQFEAAEVDGIFGLAYSALACNPTCVTPLFDTLVQRRKVRHDIFSICTQSHGGTLTLGGSDPDLYKGDLQYVPIVHSAGRHFYDVRVKGVMIGGMNVQIPDFGDTIVDSGTTVLVLAPKSYQAIKTHFQQNYCAVPGLCISREDSPSARVVERISDGNSTKFESIRAESHSWFEPGYCVRLDSRHLKMLPDITIMLDNGVKLDIDPETYMLKYETTVMFGWERVVYRCLGISYLAGLERMENNAILGNTVLQKYFVEYDRENDRIGFAVAKNCVRPKSEQLLSGSVLEEESSRGLPILKITAVIASVIAIIACVNVRTKREDYTPIRA